MDVSIIVPCYGDAPHLDANVREIIRVMQDTVWTWEIILIDDKSPDDGADIADRLEGEFGRDCVRSVRHPVNRGRGGAVMTGLGLARGDVAGFLDIDLEAHARYLPSLIRAVREGADVAVAYRIYRIALPILHRVILSRGYLWLANKLLGTDFDDTESGYKFFRRDKIVPLLSAIENSGWFWDTEIMARSHMAGLVIRSVPVLFLRNPRKRSTVRLFRDVSDYFGALWKFRGKVRAASLPENSNG